MVWQQKTGLSGFRLSWTMVTHSLHWVRIDKVAHKDILTFWQYSGGGNSWVPWVVSYCWATQTHNWRNEHCSQWGYLGLKLAHRKAKLWLRDKILAGQSRVNWFHPEMIKEKHKDLVLCSNVTSQEGQWQWLVYISCSMETFSNEQKLWKHVLPGTMRHLRCGLAAVEKYIITLLPGRGTVPKSRWSNGLTNNVKKCITGRGNNLATLVCP